MKRRFATLAGGARLVAALLAGAILATAGSAGAAVKQDRTDGTRARVDTVMENEIERQLMRDVNVDHQDIKVQVEKGVATLDGPVNSRFEERRALEDANQVSGLSKVQDKLDLRDDRKREEPVRDARRPGYQPYIQFQSDRELEQAVSEGLWWSPLVDRDEIDVDVNDGQVRLTGKVDSSTERSAAVENAWEGGAQRVKNDLRLKQEG